MECFVHPKVDYLRIPQMIAKQRDHLRARIAKICGAKVTYGGLSADERRKFAGDPYTLPGVKEMGWTRPPPRARAEGLPAGSAGGADAGADEGSAAGDILSGRRPSMLEAMRTLIHDLQRQRFSWPFRQPVDSSLVPGYDEVITDPVDLTLIQTRLESSLYTTKAQLRADIVSIEGQGGEQCICLSLDLTDCRLPTRACDGSPTYLSLFPLLSPSSLSLSLFLFSRCGCATTAASSTRGRSTSASQISCSSTQSRGLKSSQQTHRNQKRASVAASALLAASVLALSRVVARQAA